MVGAGGPPREGYRDRARLDFSNYGSRVDVQGWGRKVATLDYGDLQSCDHPAIAATPTATTRASSAAPRARRRSSPAPPCCSRAGRADRQRAARARGVRDLLRRTGTPQTDGIGGSSSRRRRTLARGRIWRAHSTRSSAESRGCECVSSRARRAVSSCCAVAPRGRDARGVSPRASRAAGHRGLGDATGCEPRGSSRAR